MPGGAEHRERAYVAASRRTDRSPEARLASAIKASQAHYERTGRRFKITMEIVLSDEMYREEEEPRSRPSVSYPGAAYGDRPIRARTRSQNDSNQESFDMREQRVNQMFDQAFPWHREQILQQRREREEREDREDREEHQMWNLQNGELARVQAARLASVSATSGASGTSGTTPSTTSPGAKPGTPALSPTPHTPSIVASMTTPVMAYDAIGLFDAMAANNDMVSGQNCANVFAGPDDLGYSPGQAAQSSLDESFLVSSATTKSKHGLLFWTPDNDEMASSNEMYDFADQSLFPLAGGAGAEGPLSDQMVAVDENGNYYSSPDDTGDYVASSVQSNMIMRSFNPAMLSINDADLESRLFSSPDPADPTTTLTEPTTMLYSTSAATTTADQDYLFSTSMGMGAFPPFSVDR